MADPDAVRPPQIRIPAGAKPKDLIPGNPDDVDDLVLELRAYAGAFQDGKDKLRLADLKDWQGRGAGEFRKAVDRLPRELTSGHDQFTHVASALASYATKLRSVQKRCEQIIEDADAARASSKAHNKKVEAYNDAVTRGDEQLPEKPAETDPGVSAMENCIGRLDKLVAELELVVDASKKKIDKATEKAPNKPIAAGEITPSLLLAVATGGSSVLRKELKNVGKTPAERLALRKKELGRDGEASDRANDKGTDKCGVEKDCETDPVDVATGEMLMSATDVSLPGALPLVLERTFVSGHTCGGWFGRTWSATLDQRLELDGSCSSRPRAWCFATPSRAPGRTPTRRGARAGRCAGMAQRAARCGSRSPNRPAPSTSPPWPPTATNSPSR